MAQTVPGESSGGPWYRQLHWQILIGLVCALVYALLVRQFAGLQAVQPIEGGGQTAVELAQSKVHGAADFSNQRAETFETIGVWRAPLAFTGDLFLRLLKLIIIPLILASIVSGILQMSGPSDLGRVGIRTIGYYLLTTLLSVTMGLWVVNLLAPGTGLDLSLGSTETLEPTPLVEVFLNIVPENPIQAFAAGDMLPTIFVAILTGLGLLVIGDQGKPLAEVFESLNALILKVTDWIMALAPIGVAGLLVDTLLDPDLIDLVAFFSDLGTYMLAVLGGLAVHAVVTLPLLLLLFARRSPREYVKAMSPALLTAFSTASSSATYPLTRECATERAGVSEKSTDFVLPLGATINMDGTALYEAVAAVFIANALGYDLAFGQQVVIVLTATLAAIGAAGVPSAGLVTMIIVLESVGLPAAGYGLVVAVDRILDMCRTAVNVWGDSIGAAVVESWLEREPT
jgi:Na+/H+-dicarboxylate symporter